MENEIDIDTTKVERGSLRWLKSHKPWIEGLMSRYPQTEPLDEYHVHYKRESG